MNKETLRMQMLAGIITEGQYKEKMEEIDSMGKIGKQTPIPGYEGNFEKNQKKVKKQIKKAKEELDNKKWNDFFFNEITNLYNDASKGLIFVSETPEEYKIGGSNSVFVDENSKYKNLLTGKRNKGLGAIGATYSVVLPKSKAISPPYKLNIDTFLRIISGFLNSGIDGNDYSIIYHGLDDMIQIGWTGYVVDMSKFKRDSPDYGFPKEIGNGMAWVPFTFRD
jgi:hypothetical protein